MKHIHFFVDAKVSLPLHKASWIMRQVHSRFDRDYTKLIIYMAYMYWMEVFATNETNLLFLNTYSSV